MLVNVLRCFTCIKIPYFLILFLQNYGSMIHLTIRSNTLICSHSNWACFHIHNLWNHFTYHLHVILLQKPLITTNIGVSHVIYNCMIVSWLFMNSSTIHPPTRCLPIWCQQEMDCPYYMVTWISSRQYLLDWKIQINTLNKLFIM